MSPLEQVPADFAGRVSRLVRDAQDGQARAITGLVNTLRPHLEGYFRRHGLPDAAEDLTVDAIGRIMRSLDRIDPARAVQWVMTTTANVKKNEYRRISREQVHLASCEIPTTIADRTSSSDSATTYHDLEAAVETALSERLTEEQGSVLRLSMAGYDYSEIAARLDICEGTVKSRLHRARCSMRDALAVHLAAA